MTRENTQTIATHAPKDDEIHDRVEEHRQRRGFDSRSKAVKDLLLAGLEKRAEERAGPAQPRAYAVASTVAEGFAVAALTLGLVTIVGFVLTAAASWPLGPFATTTAVAAGVALLAALSSRFLRDLADEGQLPLVKTSADPVVERPGTKQKLSPGDEWETGRESGEKSR